MGISSIHTNVIAFFRLRSCVHISSLSYVCFVILLNIFGCNNSLVCSEIQIVWRARFFWQNYLDKGLCLFDIVPSSRFQCIYVMVVLPVNIFSLHLDFIVLRTYTMQPTLVDYRLDFIVLRTYTMHPTPVDYRLDFIVLRTYTMHPTPVDLTGQENYLISRIWHSLWFVSGWRKAKTACQVRRSFPNAPKWIVLVLNLICATFRHIKIIVLVWTFQTNTNGHV